MLPYLNNAQSKRLQEVLQSAFVNYEITENIGNMKESERDFVEIFLLAKRIEGCSDLQYAMFNQSNVKIAQDRRLTIK